MEFPRTSVKILWQPRCLSGCPWMPVVVTSRYCSGGRQGTCQQESQSLRARPNLLGEGDSTPLAICKPFSPLAVENPSMLVPWEFWQWTGPPGGCSDAEPHSNISKVPGSPVVRTWCVYCCGLSSIPGPETESTH